MRVLAVDSVAALDGLVSGTAVASPDAGILESHGADAHRVVVGEDGLPAARCSLWWRDTPRYLHQRVGLIGNFASSASPCAERLLTAACAELARRGCALAVGPMDGSTWRNYRFVTERGEAPPFALEPENPAAWPRQFEHAGFQALATYTSAVTRQLDEPDPRLARTHDRLARAGIRVRTLRQDDFEEDLRLIHGVASVSFQNNLLYTPTPAAAFVEHYRPVQRAIDPRLVFLAESPAGPVAFLFMIPDFNQSARGESVDTAILKTVATRPERVFAGLGAYLVGHSQVRAHELGYRRVIHALMHDANQVMRISRKHADPMRRYALFSKRLERQP